MQIEKVVLAAKLAGKAIEINNNSFFMSRPGSAPRCHLFAELAYKQKALVAVNSDSHFCYTVGKFDHSIDLVNEVGIKEECILNTSAVKVKNFLQQRRKVRQKTS